MGCFDNLRLPWMRAQTLGMEDEGAGEHLAENFRMIDKWANALENHCASGGTLSGITMANEDGFELDAAGFSAFDEMTFPSGNDDAAGNPTKALEAWATSDVTMNSNGESGPTFDGDGNGMFLHSFSCRYQYQDSVARTETAVETQIAQDNTIFPTGPALYHFCVDNEQSYITHTGITFGYPAAVAIRNLSVAACYIIQPHLTIVRLITNDSSFTQVVP